MATLLLVLSLLLGFDRVRPITGLSTISPEKPCFELTGFEKILDWEPHSPAVSIGAESSLLKSGVLLRRGEYAGLSEERKEEIRIVCDGLGISFQQAMSLRKQTRVTKIMYKNQDLKRDAPKLSPVLEKEGILKLSRRVDQPPVSIARAILNHRIYQRYPYDWVCKLITKSIVNRELTGIHCDDFLSQIEQEQLEIARQNDFVSFSEPSNTGEQEAASTWEDMLYEYLDEKQINYLKEDEMRSAGFRLTPDCLILDECTIHGQKVRWIDCKNFFGSSTSKNQFLKKTKKQIKKYEDTFEGGGAIVYRAGFSAGLVSKLPSTVLLDSGPLRDPLGGEF